MKESKIITPRKGIIGGSKPEAKEAVEKRSDSFNVKEHEQFNRNIFSHPKYVENFVPRDNHVLVRLLKLTENKTSDGGLILEDYEFMETAGGQMKSRISQNPYQSRGIVVKCGHLNEPNEFQKEIQEVGKVIRIQSPRLGPEFDLEPQKKGLRAKGYYLIHVGIIIGIEKNQDLINKK